MQESWRNIVISDFSVSGMKTHFRMSPSNLHFPTILLTEIVILEFKNQTAWDGFNMKLSPIGPQVIYLGLWLYFER